MSPFASRCVVCTTLLLAGCTLDRAPILPDPPDGGSGLDARVDGSSECPPAGCDDGNPCTDDACIAGTGCVSTPNAASCDDGMLCNGGDTCADGECVHDMIDPCPGGSTCNPTSNACEGCETDADCPGEMRVPSGTCDASDTCATSGVEDVTVSSYTCDASGTCVASTRTETQPCARSTDGVSCGTARIVPGDCSYADACVESGSRTVTTFTPVCMGGSCQEVESTSTDTAGCARTTEGSMCGDPVVMMGPCSYASTCAESGTRTDTTTMRVCAAGACTTTTSTATSTCTRRTTGTVCGPCTAYDECTYTTPETCSGDAARSRLCPTCASGACPASASTVDTMPCTPASTDGTRCIDDFFTCGDCERPDGTCPSGSMGSAVCTIYFERCNAGGSCMGDAGSAMVTFPCPCP